MSEMIAEQVVSRARQIAEKVLLPDAMATDAAGSVPAAHFEALASAGLYGLAGPSAAGGLDADLATFCTVTEIMASGCLATAFVWLQHHSAVRALAASANAALAESVAGAVVPGGAPGRNRARRRAAGRAAAAGDTRRGRLRS